MGNELKHSLAIARKLIELAEARDTPLTPQNYEILFEYLDGGDGRLADKVEQALAGDGLSGSVCEEIRQTCLGGDERLGALYDLGCELNDEIGQVTSAIAAAKKTTTAYGDALKSVDGRLSDIDNAPDIHRIIEALLLSSSKMEHNTRELEARLADSSRQIESLNKRVEELRTEVSIDALTGISNRRHFDEVMRQQMRAADDTGHPLCLCLCDIDRFKDFNDNHGHQTGDHVLRLVAGTMSSCLAEHAVVARYGGEEFAVLLPETTLAKSISLANKIRETVREKELIKRSSGESLGRITISIGVACYQPGERADQLMRRADHCLYAAKRAGRDRVISETASQLPEDKQAVA